jgi:GNAT superfamily N-acetyltransferase/nitroimidazol reductase NimA-like FMN-containing flavoprotein (pyridoxamine 5'-phosphate oxidase superfamily)
MRRAEFAMSRQDAVAFLAQAPEFHLVGTTEHGEPVLRTFNGVVVDGWLCFHAAPKGEKTSLLDRPVVACAEEVVARVPSTFTDAESACSATTLFRSVQAHGVLTALTGPELKARVLQALMEKLQPEGGYRPISAGEARYAPEVRGLLVAGVPLERLDGKAKLLQNRKPAEREHVLAQLWRRGEPGDTRAIELICEANPGLAPTFLAAPAGYRLHAWLPASRLDAAVALLAGEYWNQGCTEDELRRAHLGSTVWLGASDESGRLVASARALADGGKFAWVYDVVVAAPHRGRGLGQALLGALLGHPAVRGCGRVLLATRDAQALYARFGFIPRADAPPRPFPSTEMVLLRAPAPTLAPGPGAGQKPDAPAP